MFLVRLIYASVINRETYNQETMDEILRVARKNNQKNNITGLLCFSNKYFIQCLEGGRRHVNATYEKILRDDRHSEPLLISYEEISTREFTDWSMGYISQSDLSKEAVLRHSTVDRLNPFDMPAKSCYEFMLDCKKLGLS